ncbi:GNAT family N-acetyltransferase [Natronospirillum operosum]|uniref:GNAT family N-acetyltransferase n=1 Tax=Natronospirillum operosum TaxID=2759953 RepID=A0A4Z0WH91_9GAMM|nr:GNAT family N-acetyltransferase [Natronospirillum operosum]TGG95136.1 GNAT family N-acetyltransferase [Natronospirillum operosum]
MTLAIEPPFYEFPDLSDGVVALRHKRFLQGRAAMDGVPAYLFSIYRADSGRIIGEIDLRLGATRYLRQFGGQLGYHVDSRFRGHRYAARACLLLQEVALAHEMEGLWITCNPDNLASRRTCELIGATYIDEVRVPFASELYWRGDRRKCRYHWDLTYPHLLAT